MENATFCANEDSAKRGGLDEDHGYKPGSIARSKVKSVAARFPAQGHTAVIRPYRKNVIGKGENKI